VRDVPEARRRRSLAVLEAAGAGAAGGALGGLALGLVGFAWEGAVVGAANGLLGGWRATYAWRRPSGLLAFVLDSTWAVPMTAAALVTHVVAAAQRDGGGYLAALSRRANRHVYARGFRLRRGFLITIGNTVHGAGANALTSPRRRRVVTDHEDVHVWQGRWFGPLYPLLYGGWLVVGGAIGAFVWLVRRPRAPFTKVVETCAYYLNPFEWWAYSRDGYWPPTSKVAGLGWRSPVVRPLSATRRRSARRAPPTHPAARR
jgi:hypothetical protein